MFCLLSLRDWSASVSQKTFPFSINNRLRESWQCFYTVCLLYCSSYSMYYFIHLWPSLGFIASVLICIHSLSVCPFVYLSVCLCTLCTRFIIIIINCWLCQALSVVDSAVLLSFLPHLLQSVWNSAFGVLYAYTICWANVAKYWFRTSNTWLTVLLTLNRYMRVCQALEFNRRCTVRRTCIVSVVSHDLRIWLPSWVTVQGRF